MSLSERYTNEEVTMVRLMAGEVLDTLGPGHSEAVYEGALEVELMQDFSSVRRQVSAPITYKGYVIGTGRMDIVVDKSLIIEIKTVTRTTERDLMQLERYLASTGIRLGILLNFNPTTDRVELLETDGRPRSGPRDLLDLLG